ncbi:MAG: hypothetical protein GY830_01850 [Bacteroidetes bacterium]|nr:hypothetical protein [Bacteroidota bacterium]
MQGTSGRNEQAPEEIYAESIKCEEVKNDQNEKAGMETDSFAEVHDELLHLNAFTFFLN